MTKFDLPFHDYHINRFRGLRDVSLKDCRVVNLLVGENNCGKNSILETMVLVCEPFSPDQWRLATQVRGPWPLSDPPVKGTFAKRLETVKWMFPNFAPNQREISIDLKGSCPLQSLRATGSCFEDFIP